MLRTVHRAAFVTALILATSSTTPASARYIVLEVFGHDVRLATERNEEGHETLEVNGKIVISAGSIYLDRIDEVAGVPYLAGTSGHGGNACIPGTGGKFILTFPTDEDSRLYGPIETCNAIDTDFHDDRIVMTESGYPGEEISVWTWTPGGGIVRTAMTAEADPTKSWSDLWARDIAHPSDLLGNKDAYALLQSTAGDRYPEFERMMSGVGSAEYVGDFIVGDASPKHKSLDAGQFIAIDLQTKEAFMALKLEGRKIEVFSSIDGWPETAKQGIRGWVASKGW